MKAVNGPLPTSQAGEVASSTPSMYNGTEHLQMLGLAEASLSYIARDRVPAIQHDLGYATHTCH